MQQSTDQPHSLWKLQLERAWQAPARFISRWYFAYLLLGVATAGLIPVLLPLLVVAQLGRVSDVAYVLGAYNLGLLSSPLWGKFAEARKDYRTLFLGGFALAALATAGFAILPGLPSWIVLGLLLGLGSSAASTIASLFIFDFAPREEWEPRIGWLQSFNGAGQVVGLLLAGALVHSLTLGIWITAAVLAAAVIASRVGLPVQRVVHALAPRRAIQHLDFHGLAAFGRTELMGGGLLRQSHHLSLPALRQLPSQLKTAFGRFMLSWFLLSFGVAAFFAYFPVLMRKGYGIDPGLTSLTYAVTAAIGIGLYILASRWSSRHGPQRVYRWGLLLRGCGFALLFALLFFPAAGREREGLAIVGFAAIVGAWPLLSVSGTMLAGKLSVLSEGMAIGLFNAVAAIATVAGTLLGGPLFQFAGNPGVLLLGLGGIGLSWLFSASQGSASCAT